jgi:hypothetical protein
MTSFDGTHAKIGRSSGLEAERFGANHEDGGVGRKYCRSTSRECQEMLIPAPALKSMILLVNR